MPLSQNLQTKTVNRKNIILMRMKSRRGTAVNAKKKTLAAVRMMIINRVAVVTKKMTTMMIIVTTSLVAVNTKKMMITDLAAAMKKIITKIVKQGKIGKIIGEKIQKIRIKNRQNQLKTIIKTTAISEEAIRLPMF